MSIFKSDILPAESRGTGNEKIISTYRLLREADPYHDEPNYELAEKVFLDFNEFNLRNNENRLMTELIPKSLLPYPKNYIKCSYYIILERLKREGEEEIFRGIQEIGAALFYSYPDYEKYQGNLKNTEGFRKWNDANLKNIHPIEAFKKLYGVYEVSEEDYNNSPNSTDASNEKLIYDFGILPKIEEDINTTGTH